jgi:hypothetical protein
MPDDNAWSIDKSCIDSKKGQDVQTNEHDGHAWWPSLESINLLMIVKAADMTCAI